MRPSLGRRLCVALVMSWLGLTSAHLAAQSTQWRQSVATSGPGVVQLDSVAGTLVVVGWDREQVEVSGSVGQGAGSEEPLMERRGQRVVVRLERAMLRDSASHLEVRMPRGHRLEISGLTLDVRVDGIVGGIDISVVGGTVRVLAAANRRPGPRPQRVHLDTVSGVIGAEGVFDELEMNSVSGPIEVSAQVRRLTVESESGPQTLRVRGLEWAEVASLDGPIRLDIESGVLGASRGAQIQARSFRGILDLGLPAGTPASLNATVRAGRIDNRLGGLEERESGDGEGLRLRTRLGAADPEGAPPMQIDLSTFRGDIVLRPLL